MIILIKSYWIGLYNTKFDDSNIILNCQNLSTKVCCEKNTQKIVKKYCKKNIVMVICGRNKNVEILHNI